MPVILGDGCHDATIMTHDVPLGDNSLEIISLVDASDAPQNCKLRLLQTITCLTAA